MLTLKDKLTLLAFDMVAAARGYKFVQATSRKAIEDAASVYNEDGFSFPKHLIDGIKKYKEGTINFIAYHRGMPVGLVRLADPNVINRPYELYGVDREGLHYEIQSLAVKKGFRDGTQFVMLGMVKKLYTYSLQKGITSWCACGAHSVYLSMRRYCKRTEVTDIDFMKIGHPVTSYLFENRIIETYFTMDVSAFEPWEIFRKCVRKLMKKYSLPEYIAEKIRTLKSQMRFNIIAE
jgi:hypothetical protein